MIDFLLKCAFYFVYVQLTLSSSSSDSDYCDDDEDIPKCEYCIVPKIRTIQYDLNTPQLTRALITPRSTSKDDV